jgi:manganese/zinc/iron transport system permease protein
MSLLSVYLLVIALFTALVSVIPGVFLVLRGTALMSDAISHAVLPGIVIIFLLIKQLNSVALLFGAALAGLVLVIGTQLLIDTYRIKKEVAVGLLFPLFFSIGVIGISRFARDVHLDSDMVLLGDMIFTPFVTLYYHTTAVGPYALFLMAALLAVLLGFVTIFYKQLLVATFDETYAYTIGYNPRFFYLLLMFLTSLTAVAAFDLVGSIVVVALMIVPVATAYLWTVCFEYFFWLSMLFAALSAFFGYGIAHYADVSIGGSIACMAGLGFVLSLFFAPKKGLYAVFRAKTMGHRLCAIEALCGYLAFQEGEVYVPIHQIAAHMGWKVSYAKKVALWAVLAGRIAYQKEGILLLW